MSFLKNSLPRFLLLLLLSLFPSLLQAKSSAVPAVLTSVSGKVTLVQGKKAHVLHQNSKVQEGQTLATAKDSTATIRFFDGSELQVRPDTKFTLSQVRKDGPQDKILHFKLLLGKLFAKVQALSSSQSSFEVEAGGVVCGVRGTQYEVGYDPNQGKVDLFVKEGNVWAKTGGNTYQYGAGSEGHFTGGKPNNPTGGNGQGNKDQGKKGHDTGKGNQPHGQPDNFSPFLGMGGNRPDPFQPLTGGNTDTGTVADKTSDTGLTGFGKPTLILQLKYPEQ